MSGVTVSVSREVAAPASIVWAMVTDLPRMGEWSPENRGGSWMKGATGPALGARFRGRNSNGKRSWSTVVTVIRHDEPSDFAFSLMVFGRPWCDWSWQVSPTSSGCTITHSWTDRRAGWAVRLGRLVSGVADRATHNRANMEATVDALVVAAT